MTTEGLRVASLAALLLVGVAGCDDDDETPMTFAELERELESARCAFQVRCGFMPDTDTCAAATTTEQAVFAQLDADIAAGRVIFDSEEASACLSAIRTLGCERLSLDSDRARTDDDCDEIFTGTVAVGGDCVLDEECVPDAVCDVSACGAACCLGECVQAADEPPIPIGGDCSAPGADCVPSAFCAVTETGMVCALLVAEDQPCQSLAACRPGLVCDLDFASGEGTCRRPPMTGQACDPAELFGLCRMTTDFCNPETLRCQRLLGVGELCDPTVDNCIGFAFCDPVGSRCTARPALGESCDEAGGRTCLGELDCVGGACQLPAAESVCSW